MTGRLIAALASLAFTLAGAPAASAASAEALLARLKAASGGAAWDQGGVLVTEGRKLSFGLEGAYRAVEDLAGGRFEVRADYGILANAEGLDAAGRWRVDNSGGVHRLDSPEAQAIAATEAFIARRGWLHPERGDAKYRRLGRVKEAGLVYERLLASPQGGRPLTLWIDREGRLARASFERSSHTETISYADYREAEGLVLPFRETIEDGDQSDTGELVVSRYRRQPAEADDPPPGRPAPRADFQLRAEAPAAWMRLDPTSSFLLVEARIDDAAPMLFILDTGGHDALTPDAVEALHLTTQGHGFSRGAGAGQTPTEYAKVARLHVGQAEFVDQPFLVLDLDLGMGVGADGMARPISGIIGLEVFERLAATLDFGRGELRLCPLGTQAQTPGAPIRFTDDMPVIEGAVNGKAGWFDLDTGNNTKPILFSAWTEGHGLARALAVKGKPLMGAGVGGMIVLQLGRAQSLSLAGETLAGADVLLAGEEAGALSPKSQAGNVGLSVLSGFTVSFDYARERLWLEPPESRGICR